ncbi:hypothetical protein AOLI_G00313600 [Acnodon oligacanthus]
MISAALKANQVSPLSSPSVYWCSVTEGTLAEHLNGGVDKSYYMGHHTPFTQSHSTFAVITPDATGFGPCEAIALVTENAVWQRLNQQPLVHLHHPSTNPPTPPLQPREDCGPSICFLAGVQSLRHRGSASPNHRRAWMQARGEITASRAVAPFQNANLSQGRRV